MRIRTNKLMDSCLTNLGYDFMTREITLPKKLQDILSCPFETSNDIITLTSLNKSGENPLFETASEKCYWEYDTTHFHPDMFVPKDSLEIEYLAYALESAKQLSIRLRNNFNHKTFILSIAYSETVKHDKEIEIYGSSTVRFYQMRQGCNMNLGDLDKFETDAVMEIITQ